MKKVARGVWRFVTFVTAAVVGGTPKWLADKIDEEDRLNRLV